MKWRIFYDDGSTFSDSEGPPALAPKVGVQAVAVEDPEHGRVVCNACDFYIWHTFDGVDSWQGVDFFGLWDYLSAPGLKVVLFGRTIGNLEYRAVIQRAMNDDYLPPKTAWHKGERQ